MRRFTWILCACSVMFSCQNSNKQRQDIYALARINNEIAENPQRAMSELDSIRDKMSGDSRIRMKWALLRTKAQDKAYISLEEDSLMGDVLNYFEENGTEEEKLEAYYYTAGVFRDRHNMACALEWYKKALNYGYDNIAKVDTDIVSGIGSNIAYIYARQGNYSSALHCLKENHRLTLCLPAPRHYLETHELAEGYMDMLQCYPDDVAYKDSAYHLYTENLRLYQQDSVPLNLKSISNSLGFYAKYRFEDEAQSCLELMRLSPESEYPPNAFVNIGYYYKEVGNIDSTLYYWKTALAHSPSALFRSDATYHIARTYQEIGQKDSALHYAMMYLDARDTVEVHLMREQSITANNEYNYRRQREIEERLEKQNALRWMWLLGILSLILSVMLIVIYIQYRQYKSREDARKKVMQLNVDITNVVAVFRNYAEEEREPDEDVWKELLNAVQSFYPDFQESIMLRYHNATTKEIKTLYLLKAGMKKTEIARIWGMGRSGVSNRIKHIEEKLGCKWEEL